MRYILNLSDNVILLSKKDMDFNKAFIYAIWALKAKDGKEYIELLKQNFIRLTDYKINSSSISTLLLDYNSNIIKVYFKEKIVSFINNIYDISYYYTDALFSFKVKNENTLSYITKKETNLHNVNDFIMKHYNINKNKNAHKNVNNENNLKIKTDLTPYIDATCEEIIKEYEKENDIS